MLPLALFRDMWLKKCLKSAKINKHYIKITMKIFNADEKINGEINNLLQRIKYKISKSEPGSFVYFRLYTIKNGNKIEYKEKFSNVAVFEELKQLGAIEILSRDVDEINKSLKENKKTKKEIIMEEGYLVRPIEPKFSELCKKYEELTNHDLKSNRKNVSENFTFSDRYEITVRDREIWVNNYLLARPHGIGKNFEFFDYLRSKPNTLIKKSEWPQHLKADVGNKDVVKILNELGFKGETLKAFFPKRSRKIGVLFRGDKVTKQDLEKSGVKADVFITELKLAHLKNNPK